MLGTIVTIVAISLIGSFLCSLFEAALYSIRPTLVEHLQRKGTMGASRLALLRARIDEPIAAILTLNTITHTLGATWGGALVGETYGNIWVVWFSLAFTLAVLFFTEIVPKTIGVIHASALGPLVAWPIQFTIWSLWPLVRACVLVTQRLARQRKPDAPSEDEILIMADMAVRAGKLLPDEEVWVANALRLNNVTARQLMTPRTMVESLPRNLTLAEAQPRVLSLTHSRLPLTESDDLDTVVGLVHRRDIFDQLVRGESAKTLGELMRPVSTVPSTIGANDLLAHFLEKRQHLAIVRGEHGDVRGIVTMEDILEYLLGREIVDEYDLHPDLQEAARRQAAKRHSRS